jgi:hypothetical protein
MYLLEHCTYAITSERRLVYHISVDADDANIIVLLLPREIHYRGWYTL